MKVFVEIGLAAIFQNSCLCAPLIEIRLGLIFLLPGWVGDIYWCRDSDMVRITSAKRPTGRCDARLRLVNLPAGIY